MIKWGFRKIEKAGIAPASPIPRNSIFCELRETINFRLAGQTGAAGNRKPVGTVRASVRTAIGCSFRTAGNLDLLRHDLVRKPVPMPYECLLFLATPA